MSENPEMSKFTPHAQQTLALARKEADRFNHNFVGTEHVLLGLIKLGQGTGINVLRKLGVDLDAVRLEIEKQVGSGPPEGKLIGTVPPNTPRVKKVLTLAAEEARKLNHTYVGTEHILLGLLVEGDGVAARVLKQVGVEIEKTRIEILREIDPKFEGPTPVQKGGIFSRLFSRTADKPGQGSKTPDTGNFTPRAQQVLALARKEADRFNHNFVGTEHLLLGLIKLGQGVGVNVLLKLGLDLEIVRAEVEKVVGTGPDSKMVGNIPYTPRVKKVLALAAKEARNLHHSYLGTEHILLGLLLEGDGVAARVFKNLKLDVEKTRIEILEELAPHFPPNWDQKSPPEKE